MVIYCKGIGIYVQVSAVYACTIRNADILLSEIVVALRPEIQCHTIIVIGQNTEVHFISGGFFKIIPDNQRDIRFIVVGDELGF